MKVNEFVELVKKVNPKIRSEVGAKIESYEEDINNVRKDLGLIENIGQKLADAQEVADITVAVQNQELAEDKVTKKILPRNVLNINLSALSTKGLETERDYKTRNPLVRIYYKLQRSILNILKNNDNVNKVIYPGIGPIYIKHVSGSTLTKEQRQEDTFAQSNSFDLSVVGVITDEKGNNLFINEKGELSRTGTKVAYYSINDVTKVTDEYNKALAEKTDLNKTKLYKEAAEITKSQEYKPDTEEYKKAFKNNLAVLKSQYTELKKIYAYINQNPSEHFIMNHITGGSFGQMGDKNTLISSLNEPFTLDILPSGSAVLSPESISDYGQTVVIKDKPFTAEERVKITNLLLDDVYKKDNAGNLVLLTLDEKEALVDPLINMDKLQAGNTSLRQFIRDIDKNATPEEKLALKGKVNGYLGNRFNISSNFVKNPVYNDYTLSTVGDKTVATLTQKDYIKDYIGGFTIPFGVDSEGKAGLFNSYFTFTPVSSENIKINPELTKAIEEVVEETKVIAEESAPVDKGVTDQGPADSISVTGKIIDSLDAKGLFEKRAGVKALNKQEVQAKLNAAYEWYMNSPLKDKFEFTTMVSAVNSENNGPAATWTVNGIVLYHYYNENGVLDKTKSGDYTDLYHEAWHGFTQTFLTAKERFKLYKEISKQSGSFRDYNGNYVTFANANPLQLEEFLAEDFRQYMLSGGKTDLKATPVKKSIFEKILSFLKTFFGKANVMDVAQANETQSFPAVIELYEKLRIGDLSSFTFDVNNRDKSIGELKSTVQKLATNDKDENLDYQNSQLLVDTIDSILSDLADNANVKYGTTAWTTHLLKTPENIKEAYKGVKQILSTTVRPNLVIDLEASTSDIEKEKIQKSIDLVDYAIRNFGDTENLKKNRDGNGLIAYHQMKSKYISYEDRADFFDDLDEEGISEKGGKNFDKSGNEKSFEQYANPDVHALLRSLYNFDKKTNKIIMNELGVPSLVPYVEVWNKVARVVSGTIDEDVMWDKLKIAALTDGTIEHLIKKLGDLDRPDRTLYPKEFDLQSKFWQTFNLSKIDLIQMNVEEEKNDKGVVNYKVAIGKASSVSKKIGDLWENTLRARTDYENGYIKKDTTNNANYIDIAKVIKDFKDAKGQLDPNKILSFYDAIGLTFSEGAKVELAKDKKAQWIFNNLKRLNSQRDISKVYSIKDMFREYPQDGKLEAIESIESNYTRLQDVEARYSDFINNSQVTNAEGNSQYEHTLNNTLSIQVNALNSVDSYEELMAIPYMAHLNSSKNTWVTSSIWMNSLFEMDKPIKTKRLDSDGNPVKIVLNNLSGIQFITESGANGISSASSDEFTKFIQDFHLNVVAGKPELMRHADKSTSFSAYISKLRTGTLYIDTNLLVKNNGQVGFDKALGYIKQYIGSELKRIKNFEKLSKEKGLEMDFNFLKEGQRFVVFEDIISKEVQAKLIAKDAKLTIDEIFDQDPELLTDVSKDVRKYFDKQFDDAKELLKDRDFISERELNNIQKNAGLKSTDRKIVKDGAVRSFVFNSWFHNIESMAIIYGDLAQYNNAKEEFHKRNAGAGSTGTIFRTSARAINFVNGQGRLYERYLKNKGILPVTHQENKISLDGELTSAVINDHVIGSQYIDEIEGAIADDIKNTYKDISPEDLEKKLSKAIGDYRNKMEEGNAQGWITFDAYRALSRLNNVWTDEQEAMYKKIANGEKLAPGKTMEFFPVRKFQYFGTLKNEHAAMTAFHKFSLMPLIPSVIEGKKIEDLHNKMMNEGIDYALFQTGSKVATITKDGVGNEFYTNPEERTIVNMSSPAFVKNVVYLQFMKNQLEIAPEFKGNVTFPTQMRKLIENGLMEGGVPIDFQPNRDLDTRIANWANIKDKEAESNVYKTVIKYENHVRNLTDLLKEELIEQADLKFDSAGNVIFSEKLQNFLVKELERQDLGDHEIDFVKYSGKSVARDLSLSLSAEKLEKVLNSIVVNRLVRQKFNGEGLIQVATSGFESKKPLFKAATKEEQLKYNGTNDLPFYGRGKGKDGKTSATKIKVALQGDFLKLLQLNDLQGKKIKTIERLNELIRDDKWLDTGDNRSMVTLVGARIPVQGMNSMEFMEVYEFLKPEAGNIIILPSEIVAKSGSDFDIDKLTVMMPNLHLINGEAKLIKIKSVLKGSRQQLKKDLTKELDGLFEQKTKIESDYKTEYALLKEDNEFKKLSLEEKTALQKAFDSYDQESNELRDQINELRPQWTKLFNKKVSDIYTPEDFERVDYQLSKALDDLEIATQNWNENKKNYKKRFKSEKIKQFWSTQDTVLNPILDRIAAIKTDLAGISPKAYQNAIISDMREMLEMPENYLSLVKPNSTYILKDEIADKIADDVQDYDPKYRVHGDKTNKIAGSRVFEIGYNLYKHKSNNIGKQVLGMFAVGNTYNSIFNRIGMKLNNSYTFGKGKGTFNKRLDILLKHNTLKDANGNDVISLSHLKDANKEYNIADLVSQLINGSVDVAKDSWLFHIQGNKEVGPTLEFLLETGVPVKQAVYFVSQPIIRAYVDQQRKAKSTFANVLGESITNPNFYQNYARDKMLGAYLERESQFYFSPYATYNQKQKSLYDTTLDYTDTNEFRDFISGSNAEQNLRTKMKDKDLIDDSGQISDIDKGMLLHFFEIENMAKAIRDIKLRTNFDTTRSSSTYEAEDKIILADELENNKMIPAGTLDKIKKDTVVGSFYVQEFQVGAWKGFFELRNNDKINSFIRDYIKENRSKIEEEYDSLGEFIKDFKNNLNSFIFQNELKSFDISKLNSFKGLQVRNGQNIVDVEPAMRLKSGVTVKAVDGVPVVYIDRAQLVQDFKNKKFGSDPVYKNGKLVVTPAKVNPLAFTDEPEGNYYKFIIEREILRSIKSKASIEERGDYKNLLDNNTKNSAKYKDESAEQFATRMEALTYEQILRDMALDNTFNRWKMFKSDSSMADQFIQILRQYPDLASTYNVVKNLTINESKKTNRDKIPTKNIVFADSLLTGDRLNIFNQNLLELSNVSKIKLGDDVSEIEKQRVANFFDMLSMYAFLQSGMNTTGQFSLIRAVPQTRFLTVMTPGAANFVKNINNTTLLRYTEVLLNNHKDYTSRVRGGNFQIANYDLQKDKANPKKSLVEVKQSDVKVPTVFDLEEDNMGNGLYNTSMIENEKTVVLRTEYATELLAKYPDEIFVHTSTPKKPSTQAGQLAFHFAENNSNALPLLIKPKANESYTDQTIEQINKGQTGVRPITQTQATVTSDKVLEGDIFSLPGIPVITTNLGGVHGAGLAQAAKAKGLIKQGEGDFKATSKVVSLPVKKVWSDNMSMNNNMDLLKNSLRSLIKVAKANTDKTFLLPLAGLGHGEGSIQDILPLLISTVQASPNIKLVIPAEGVSLGRQGSVRKDYTRENMPTIKAMLTQAGLLGTQPSTSVNPAEFNNYHGGAKKYDTYWEQEGKNIGVTKHIVYTVDSYNKLDQATKDKLDVKYEAARTWLGRTSLSKDTYAGKLVRRDMMQAAKADGIFAVSEIVAPGTKGRKGYVNKTSHPIIEGGTGYAVASGILLGKPVYVFNQDSNYGYETGWYKWDSTANDFVKTDIPVLTKNYAGIGSSTNETEIGRQAIRDVYQKTFSQPTQASTSVEPTVEEENVSKQVPGFPLVNAEAKQNIDAFMEAALTLKAAGKKLNFPKEGLGQDMMISPQNKPSVARQTFLYLSTRLLELDYVNNNFDRVLVDPQNQSVETGLKIIQEFQDVYDEDASDNILNCIITK